MLHKVESWSKFTQINQIPYHLWNFDFNKSNIKKKAGRDSAWKTLFDHNLAYFSYHTEK